MTLMDQHVVKSELLVLLLLLVIIIRFSDVIEITEKPFEEIREDRRRRVCDHVEKMINQMKATDLYTWEQGERLMT